MSLRPLDTILREFRDLTEEDRRLAAQLHDALGGAVKRDTSDNHAQPIADELDAFAKGFDEFMTDPQNQAFFLKS